MMPSDGIEECSSTECSGDDNSFSSNVSIVVAEDREEDEVEEGRDFEIKVFFVFLFDFINAEGVVDFGEGVKGAVEVEEEVEEETEKEDVVMGAQSKSGKIFCRSNIKSNSWSDMSGVPLSVTPSNNAIAAVAA